MTRPEITDLLAAYNKLTETLGFGLCSHVALIGAGATWPLIHQLIDAGLIRFHDAHSLNGDKCLMVYRLLFP